MKHADHYVEWRETTSNSMDEKISEIMKHWQQRYELGTAVLLSQSPATTLKNVTKQWRKLTRQLQKTREKHQTAEELLNTTRTISRMQRVKFTTSSPAEEPNATFYILAPENITSVPTHCYTLYSIGELNDEQIFAALAPDALAVLYTNKSVSQSPSQLKRKSVLEEHLITEQTKFEHWLGVHDISLSGLSSNIEMSNQALDTLLSSTNLQAEFLHKTNVVLRTLQLAQPIQLSEDLAERIAALKQLQKHVQLLSSTYLSDHVLDSSNDDSFLLRDIASGWALTLDSLKTFINNQREAGRLNLAQALEQKAGFTLLH